MCYKTIRCFFILYLTTVKCKTIFVEENEKSTIKHAILTEVTI